MILLGAYAGLRVSEIAAIRGEHVDLIMSTLAITGKGEKTHCIPLHPILQGLAVEMPERSWWFPSWVGNHEYGAGGPVLGNSVSAGISKAVDRAGVPGKPHSPRHWFGSSLKGTGVDSLVIKELMGHESLATTAIYVNPRVPLRMQCAAVNLLPDAQPQARQRRIALPQDVPLSIVRAVHPFRGHVIDQKVRRSVSRLSGGRRAGTGSTFRIDF